MNTARPLLKARLVLVGLLLTVVGCVPVNETILDRSRMSSPVPPNRVHIYRQGDTVPPYRRIAILDARGNSVSVRQGELVAHLRKEAGKLGANAIILEPVSNPSFGTQVASAMTGTSSNRKEQAIAIFVPSLRGCSGGNCARLGGTYRGTWSLEAEAGIAEYYGWPSEAGSVTISTRNRGSITGSFIIKGDRPLSGSISGRIQTDGGVSFGLTVPGSNPNGFEAATGCVVTSADNELKGTISNGVMSVSASFHAACPNGSGGTVPAEFNLSFTG